MCNGHEHVCLEVNMTLFLVYCSLGMALIMTGAHGWSWWWLQKRTLLGEKPLVVAWCRGLHLDQEPEAVLHLETQYGLVFQSWNLQKKGNQNWCRDPGQLPDPLLAHGGCLVAKRLQR